MYESIHKPDDDQSSDNEILHPFEPDMFESIHKPDDDQSSDNEILHPFEPQALCMSLMIVMMRKLFMSLKAESSRVVATLIVHLQVVLKIIC